VTSMITFQVLGDFNNTMSLFKKSATINNTIRSILTRYGHEGVAALSAATPVDTGKTAQSWSFTVTDRKLTFLNNNVDKNGTPIAILIQYGHGGKNGVHIKGKDYINPAIAPVFNKILDDIWREVTSL